MMCWGVWPGKMSLGGIRLADSPGGPILGCTHQYALLHTRCKPLALQSCARSYRRLHLPLYSQTHITTFHVCWCRQQLQAALQVVDSGLGAPAGLLGSPTTPGATTSAPGSTSSWSSCLRPALALDCLLLRIKAQVGGQLGPGRGHVVWLAAAPAYHGCLQAAHATAVLIAWERLVCL
jgi:hypothetical protein